MDWMEKILTLNTLYGGLFGACLGALWIIMGRVSKIGYGTDAIRESMRLRMDYQDREIRELKDMLKSLHEKYGAK